MWSNGFTYGRQQNTGTDDSYYPSMATLAAWGAPPVVELVPGIGVKLSAYPVPPTHANDKDTVCVDGTCRHYVAGLLTRGEAYPFGYWEYKAQVPVTKGWWPALGELSGGNGIYNEVDNLEVFSEVTGLNVMQQTMQGSKSMPSYARLTVPTASTAMHSYAAIVTPSYTGFYIENVATSGKILPSGSTAPMLPIMNLHTFADGSWGAPSAGNSTASILVEHYRYYAPPEPATPCATSDVPQIK